MVYYILLKPIIYRLVYTSRSHINEENFSNINNGVPPLYW